MSPSLFTWTAQRDFAPLALAGGEGAWFWDAEGRRYLDFASVVFSANAGHNHPRILAALRRQLEAGVVAGPAMAPAIREQAAAALARHTPAGLDRFLFTLGGADANEHAVKIAMLATGRTGVLCRARSYHGATFGALSFSDDPRGLPLFPHLPGVVRVRDPYCFRCPWETRPEVCVRECVTEVETAIAAAGPETIACVLMETVPGTNGGYFPPADYYRRLREICDRSGILLILDEVLTGFGRTGRWFACEEYGVVPDMMTLGKGITSGHAPLGAVAVHERLARHFDDHVLSTGLTHTAHPLSLAAALGNVEALEAEGLVERAAILGERLAERLCRLARHPAVADVRSRGLYACLELRPEADALATKRAAFARGLYLAARPPYLFVAPPLVVTAADLEAGLDIVDQALEVRS